MKTGPDPAEFQWLVQLHLARYSGRLARADVWLQRHGNPGPYDVAALHASLAVWTRIAQAGEWARLSAADRLAVLDAAEEERMDTNGWRVST